MMTKRRNRFTSGVLAGAGAAALAGALVFADPLGATEGAMHAKEAAPADAGVVLADGAQRTIDAGDAGLVTLTRIGDDLQVIATTPSSGWTVLVKKPTGHMVKVLFTSADGAVVKVKAHLAEDGRFRFGVAEKGKFDRVAFEKAQADKAAFFQAVAENVAAEKAAAEKAAAEKAVAERAAAARAAEKASARKAAAASVEGDDKRDHDGRCGDKGGEERGDFEAARADDDHHDGDRDHDGWDGHRKRS